MKDIIVFATCIAILLLWLNIGLKILELTDYNILPMLMVMVISLLVSFVVAGIATILTR
jgi:hypothetical protein